MFYYSASACIYIFYSALVNLVLTNLFSLIQPLIIRCLYLFAFIYFTEAQHNLKLGIVVHVNIFSSIVRTFNEYKHCLEMFKYCFHQ